MPELPERHDSTKTAAPDPCVKPGTVMLALAKLQLMRYARSAINPVKVAIANRLADEIRLLEAMESGVSRG